MLLSAGGNIYMVVTCCYLQEEIYTKLFHVAICRWKYTHGCYMLLSAGGNIYKVVLCFICRRKYIQDCFMLLSAGGNKYTVVSCRVLQKKKTQTRGPKGPWVAHLRKRSKVTVEPFTEDH